ncbi:hypothetical protein F5878DRAFT_665571 [Lentinula raphanica]|uniref:Uncharacterized protein n=1 Tax=Lentinula raphanica TaxID=153919 RepID=A0AA38NZK3_9AGAR|nr:hypothetical protein F5878DRAFT_665571 [Lentinula raphanica]
MLKCRSIHHAGTTTAVTEVLAEASALKQKLADWRASFPDLTPHRINNKASFFNPGCSRSTVALITYMKALVDQIFYGIGSPAAGLTLRFMKIFGNAVTALSGGPNLQQKLAFEEIPDTIETVGRRFNLNVPTIPYAVCPTCCAIYEPSYPGGPKSVPVYQAHCSNRSAEFRGICGAPVVDVRGSPIKTFEYYSFFEWFGCLLALPGIERYGDSFCEEIDETPESPGDKKCTSDGRFYRKFTNSQGGLFVADRGSEGRWFFSLHADFFNIEGNLQGKQVNSTKALHESRSPAKYFLSTGVLSITCLNLPIALREDPAFTLIFGLIAGPHEPSTLEAQHQHYLKPLMEELVIGYEWGVTCYASASDSLDPNSKEHLPYQRTHRIALACIKMDLKVSRPFCGLSDVIHRKWCFYCQIWHPTNTLRTDISDFGHANDMRLREGAEKWRQAQSTDERDSVYNLYGTRYSAFWMLPYWCPSRQITIDPMHTMFLILMQNFFRSGHALGLQNPDDKGSESSHHNSSLAFHHDFPLFPDLAILNTEAISNAPPLENLFCQLDLNSLIAVGDLHRYLCQPLEDSEQGVVSAAKLSAKLNRAMKPSLEYVCTELDCLPAVPSGNPSKQDMVKALIRWRSHKPVTLLSKVPVDSAALLDQLHCALQEVILVPAWVRKPPVGSGLARVGTLKADHWRTMFDIYLPLAQLSLWQPSSPLVGPDAIDRFQTLLQRHILGLKQSFPGFALPSHHLAFHMYDFMDLFSNVRNWWCFPGENLIQRLRQIPTNHKTGKFESTLLHSFSLKAAFQRWLWRPDCPPLVKSCQKLLDKIFGSESEEVPEEDNARLPIPYSSDRFIPGLGLMTHVQFLAQIKAPSGKGFFTIPNTPGEGNSYIYYFPEDSQGSEWVAARIQYIFEEDHSIKLVVRCNLPQQLCDPDPFKAFWFDGFEAKLVSSELSETLEILELDRIIGHTARWNLNSDLAVLLALPPVSINIYESANVVLILCPQD